MVVPEEESDAWTRLRRRAEPVYDLELVVDEIIPLCPIAQAECEHPDHRPAGRGDDLTHAHRKPIWKVHEWLRAAFLGRDVATDTHEGLQMQLGGTPS